MSFSHLCPAVRDMLFHVVFPQLSAKHFSTIVYYGSFPPDSPMKSDKWQSIVSPSHFWRFVIHCCRNITPSPPPPTSCANIAVEADAEYRSCSWGWGHNSVLEQMISIQKVPSFVFSYGWEISYLYLWRPATSHNRSVFFNFGIGTPMGLRSLSCGVAAIYRNKKGWRPLSTTR